AQQRVFSIQEMGEIAKQVDPQVTFEVHDDYALSASEIFALLNKFVTGVSRRKASGPILLESTPYGPDSRAPELPAEITVPWSQFSRTALDVGGFLETRGQIPSQVWLGSAAVSPESYL